MRRLLLFLSFLLVSHSLDSGAGTYANASAPAIKSIDDTAIERVKNAYDEAEMAKNELYSGWAERVKQIWHDKMMKDAEKALQLELIKQQMVDRYKQETEKVYQQAVEAAKEYQQAYIDAKAAQKQAIAEKYSEFKKRVNESIEAHIAQAKENMAEVNAYLQQVDQLYQKHKADSEAAIEERRQALKEKLNTIFTELKSRNAELDTEEAELKGDLKAFIQKRYQYKKDAKGAMEEVLKEGMTEALERKLEKKLDKELKDMVQEEIKSKFKHPKMALPGLTGQTKTISPEYKATLLETLTGASAWETVAWVLLALCILLSVALIALIAYQVSQRNKYGKLEGTDSPHRPSVVRSERAPLNTAPPLHYTQEKPAFSSPPPLAGPSVVTASDPLPPPVDEQQQF